MLHVITTSEHYQFRHGLAEQEFLDWCAQLNRSIVMNTKHMVAPRCFATGSFGTRGLNCPCATT